MNSEHNGPIINSRHHSNMPKPNKSIFVIIFLIVFTLIITAVLGFLETKEVISTDIIDSDNYENSYNQVLIEDTLNENFEDYANEIDEDQSAQYHYERALEMEKDKDYKAAVKDYDKAIEKADKYSKEMFNSLNNRGFIKAKYLKEYESALKDFDKIIEIEYTKTEYNNQYLEAAFTNRAYVQKMLGRKESACDDLYNALSYCKESSTSFIEKQIEKNCW